MPEPNLGGAYHGEPYVSNELIHFLGRGEATDASRFALLKTILATGTLKRGAGKVSAVSPGGSLAGRTMYDPDVVCFCDIPLGGVRRHMEHYGPFGIAFGKRELSARGNVSPVFYVAAGSRVLDVEQGGRISRAAYFDKMVKRVHDHMEEQADQRMVSIQCTFNGIPTGESLRVRTGLETDPVLSMRRFFDTEIFPFITFFDEQLEDGDEKNFYMEREWRTIGELHFQRADVRRLIMPKGFIRAFRREMLDWADTTIHAAEEPMNVWVGDGPPAAAR